MNITDLKPVDYFVQNYGTKMLAYGPAGSAKTPLIATAPRPLFLSIEPGIRSMQGMQVPTWRADTTKEADEFMAWFSGSSEVRNFDTICVDSISHWCDLSITEQFTANPKSHGLKVYGNMATDIGQHLKTIYYKKNINCYLIAKEALPDEDNRIRRPYFPGKVLPIDAPHLFDLVARIAIQQVPGAGETLAIRTKSNHECIARDRSGKLAELEPPNLGNIFAKSSA